LDPIAKPGRSLHLDQPYADNKFPMPKANTKTIETSLFHNIDTAELADMHGRLGAEIAELEARRKAIADEMIARGIPRVEGGLFESTVVNETMVANIDRQAIERDMGESWLAKYLKWSRRCASVRTTPRDHPSNNLANSDLPRGRAVAMPAVARHGRRR
jgi:hypothetical protein